MVVLAGLPPTTYNGALNYLEDRFPKWKFKGSASVSRDGGDLYPQAKCDELVEVATEFALAQRMKAPAPVTPRSIILLYVPSPDSERLLKAFDFVAMPERLAGLQAWHEGGSQLRHSRHAVEAALSNALAPSGRARMALNLIVERLGRAVDSEAMLLPAQTFRVGEADLAEMFTEFRRGRRPWSDRFAELGPTALDKDDIDRIDAGRTRRAFVDGRNIAYLTAHPKAYHAPARELMADAPAKDRMGQLRMLYRFGGALPSGFHHDACYSDGSAFLRTRFLCSVDGEVEVTAAYANIYPDDYLRITRGKKVAVARNKNAAT